MPIMPSLSARDWTLAWNLGFEITQPRPERALVQIHFCDADSSPFPGLGEHAAVLAIDGGEHPIPRHVFVRAADEIDLVLARAGARLLGIAAPHRPRNDFRAAIAQLPGDFGKKSVVANHHAYLAQARVEDRIIAARRHAFVAFAVRQTDFPIFARELAIGSDQYGHVEQLMPGAFDEAGHDVEFMLFRQFPEVIRRRTGNAFSTV